METLLDRLRPLWPVLHERAGAVAVHAQLWLTGAMMLVLFLAPGQTTDARPTGPEQVAPVPTTEVRTARVAPERPHTSLAPTPAAPPPVGTPSPAVQPTVPSPPAASTTGLAGLPETGADYRKTRRSLINRGFKPARVAPPECRGPEPSVDACWGKLVEFPEIEACWGKDGASCAGWWVAPDGKVLKIRTGGEASRIVDLHWASQGEIDDLPEGWRP